MTYVMSDLHGCYDKYVAMLEKIGFSENDTLYILGDVVDRGEDGIRILQDMMPRKNILTLRGNHDDWANIFLHLLKQDEELTERAQTALQAWLLDGGKPTFLAFAQLGEKEQADVLAYLNSFWLYDELEVGGRKFFLSHTVPEKEKMQDFGALSAQDFTFAEPEYEKTYFPDTYLITGHTPTSFIDPNSRGKIWHGNNHIAIDCGAVFGNPLGCLCLDTMEEFYVA